MPDDDFGPVLVTVEYQVAPEQDEEFLKAVRQYRRIRRRDGAKVGHLPRYGEWTSLRRNLHRRVVGPNISGNTNDSRWRIARQRSECSDVSYPSRKSGT